MAKTIEAAALPEGAELAILRAEVAALRAELKAATAVQRPDEPTLIPEDFKRWASLSATEKTQLAADKKHPPGPGTQPFEVQLVYLPKHSGKVTRDGDDVNEPAWESEYPRVKINAHNEPEAKALYQDLCGITGFDQAVSELVAVPG